MAHNKQADGFGECPICGRWERGNAYIGSYVWLYCDEHRVRWSNIVNLASDVPYPDTDEGEADRHSDEALALKVEPYRDVTDEVFGAVRENGGAR